VFTIERVPELAVMAETRLTDLGYRNIRFSTGDGTRGWLAAAPFDLIMVTAAAPALPPEWTEQLAEGGRLLAPVGSAAGDDQRLVLVEKRPDGTLRSRDLQAVRFVPLVSDDT
jgi:protein-L-isoaspartate(D-aspartate) O-methyltransferase